MASLLARLLDEIRGHGPLTVAAFMERALYDPGDGYYTSAAQRSGRAGDFYTSVDAGPIFGQVLAEFVVRAWRQRPAAPFDLVEAGAGNGRLARDVLDALRTWHPDCHASLRVTLVERSALARAAHDGLRVEHAPLSITSSPDLPDAFEGVLIANELLDAMPFHRVVQTDGGLQEAYVTVEGDTLALTLGDVSSPVVGSYLDGAGVSLPVHGIADVSPAAAEWSREAARRLRWGAMLLIDYGYEAADLFSEYRLGGTLASYARHQLDPSRERDTPSRPAWLEDPGQRDLTAHVDFTTVARAAESAGARREWFGDQTRLMLGLGLADRLAAVSGPGVADVKWRLAAKTLVGPHGIGGTHRALLMTKGISGGSLVGLPW